MKLKAILFGALASAMLFTMCKPEEENPQKEPAVVSKLTAPRDGMSVNVVLLENDLRFEWQAATGEVQKYELVFDKTGGNFSSPIATYESKEAYVSLSKDEINGIYDAAKDGSSATVIWGVFAVSADGRTISDETRTITFTTDFVPPVVETLITPENEAVLNLAKLTADVDFTWSAAVWQGSGNVTYTFVIDEADKDFSAPVYSEETSALTVTVTKEKIAELYAASQAAATDEPYELQWAVYSHFSESNEISVETRTFSIIPEVKFNVGDALYIAGTGVEANQQANYIPDSYYTDAGDLGDVDALAGQDYDYEIYTKLSAGAKFCFRTENDDHFYTLDAAGNSIKEVVSADAAEGTVAEEGIYRIRFNVAAGTAYIAKVDRAYIMFCWTEEKTDLSYDGNGVWANTAHRVKLIKTDWGFDERYRIYFVIDGNEQPYGQSVSGDRPGRGTEAAYWYMQPVREGDKWARAFKYPDWLCDGENLTRWETDVYVYMNNEKGHYTHEFKNEREYVAPPVDMLYIKGTGTEDGQQASYIDDPFGEHGKAGDVEQFANQTYDYEIFTKLSSGAKFYFSTASGDKMYSLNAAGTEVHEISSASAAEGTVSQEGIYRIRFSTEEGTAYIVRIDKVTHHLCARNEETDMTYVAKGEWKVENLNLKVTDMGGWWDERYKFRFVLAGTEQDYGARGIHDRRPTADEDKTYWKVQPTLVDQWDPAFKIPEAVFDTNSSWYADVHLYMNATHGFYTHELTNTHK